MPESQGRVLCLHPTSGSILVGEVVHRNDDGDVEIIPEGLLEQVLVRNGPWIVHDWNGRGD